jgi:hypothetical protein
VLILLRDPLLSIDILPGSPGMEGSDGREGIDGIDLREGILTVGIDTEGRLGRLKPIP